jgi:hypothetical protein
MVEYLETIDNANSDHPTTQVSPISKKPGSDQIEKSPRDHFESEKIEKKQTSEISAISQNIKDYLPKSSEPSKLPPENTKIEHKSELKNDITQDISSSQNGRSHEFEKSPRDHFKTEKINSNQELSESPHSISLDANISDTQETSKLMNENLNLDNFSHQKSEDTEASIGSQKSGSDQVENSPSDHFESEKIDQNRNSANSPLISNHREIHPNQEEVSKITEIIKILGNNTHQEEKNPQATEISQNGESHEFEKSPRDHFETENNRRKNPQ